MANRADQADAAMDELGSFTASELVRKLKGFNARDVSAANTKRILDAAPGSLPAGGTAGQVLTKESEADGDADWQDAGGGSVPIGTAIWKGPYSIPFNAPIDGDVGYAIADLFQPEEGDWILGSTVDPIVLFDVTVGVITIGHYDAGTDTGVDLVTIGLGGLTPATDRSGVVATLANVLTTAQVIMQWVDPTTPMRAHWVNGGDSMGQIDTYFLVASGVLP